MKKSQIFLLSLLLGIVYLIGLFLPLMQNDSAQFATMSMRMFLENDYLNLIKGENEYLDKPHMHYWLAALSYKIFGLHDWAYRLPSFIFLLIAAYSCYGLGKLLYNKQAGLLSALIFMASQTIVFAGHDTRTDSVLTGATALAFWKMIEYLQTKDLKSILIGSFATAIAFSTKGQIAVVVIGTGILVHLFYTQKFDRVFSWKILLGILTFALGILPILYAYYHQFDMHPEKVVRGMKGVSGVKFILLGQSVERLTAGNTLSPTNASYFFFYHSLLWCIFPFTVILFFALYHKIKTLIYHKFSHYKVLDFVTLGSFLIVLHLINFAQFKLPHYLNILIPIVSILMGGYLVHASKKALKSLVIIHWIVFVLVLALIVFVGTAIFPFDNFWTTSFIVLFIALGLGFILKPQNPLSRLMSLCIVACVSFNFFMNTHFIPKVMKFQPEKAIAKQLKEENENVDHLYYFHNGPSWALSFYSGHYMRIYTPNSLSPDQKHWVYTTPSGLNALKQSNTNISKTTHYKAYPVTRIRAKFLNPERRESVIKEKILVEIN